MEWRSANETMAPLPGYVSNHVHRAGTPVAADFGASPDLGLGSAQRTHDSPHRLRHTRHFAAPKTTLGSKPLNITTCGGRSALPLDKRGRRMFNKHSTEGSPA